MGLLSFAVFSLLLVESVIPSISGIKILFEGACAQHSDSPALVRSLLR